MRKRNTFICAFVLFFSSMSVFATVVSDLYVVQIPATSRSENLRARLLSQALAQVLIRVSGHLDVLKNEDVREALKGATDYVNQYQYLTGDSKRLNQPLLLHAAFNQVSVNRLLQSANMPIWSEDRPLVLVWFVLNNKNSVQLIGADSENVFLKTMQEHAQLRGIPLLFPILDLTDFTAVSAEDISHQSVDAILNASKRYSPNAILVVNVDDLSAQQVMAHWLLLSDNQRISWTTSGIDEHIIIKGVDRLMLTLAAQYASTATDMQKINLSLIVKGLSNLSDYAKIMNYLRHRNGVVNIEVVRVSASDVIFNLTLNTNIEALKKSIALNNVLIPVETAGPNDEEVLTYTYVK